MAYTDLTTSFTYKSLLNHQKGSQLLDNDIFIREHFMKYRRPSLVWIDADSIDVENNVASDINATKVVFPDGDVRTVSEDTSSSNVYRRLKRTESHSLSAAHNSGGNSPSNDTWIAVYAVKTSDDSSKFVLAGSATLPVPGNQATLDSAFGSDAWVYLGLLRNGDGASVASGFLDFVQQGNLTLFRNTVGSNSNVPMTGVRLTTTAGATSLTYSHSAGTSGAVVPNNILICGYGVGTGTDNDFEIRDSANSSVYFSTSFSTAATYSFAETFWIAAVEGMRVNLGTSKAIDIFLTGYIDDALTLGSNQEV